MTVLELCGIEVRLLPQRAVWIPEMNLMLIADLHLGKARHFQKAGLPVPFPAQMQDYSRLRDLLQLYTPESVIFLGDLFHSSANGDCDDLGQLLREFPCTHFVLTKGNHDILKHDAYQVCGLHTEDEITIGPFTFTHMPPEVMPSKGVHFCGHIHPGVSASGPARQSMRLPCFLLRKNTMILPAFGNLTGLHILNRQKGDQTFCVLPDKVVALPVLA